LPTGAEATSPRFSYKTLELPECFLYLLSPETVIHTGSTLSSQYASLKNNEAVLQAAQPAFFNPAYFNPSTNKELWAEEHATVSGNKDGGPSGVDSYFKNQQFSCTQTLINSLISFGQVPGRSGSYLQWPSGQSCPTF
jgi:hypothetical protein